MARKESNKLETTLLLYIEYSICNTVIESFKMSWKVVASIFIVLKLNLIGSFKEGKLIIQIEQRNYTLVFVVNNSNMFCKLLWATISFPSKKFVVKYKRAIREDLKCIFWRFWQHTFVFHCALVLK